MIRSNYVQVTRAKATLVSRVYHRVSPARITRLRLGDTGFLLRSCIINFVTKVYHQMIQIWSRETSLQIWITEKIVAPPVAFSILLVTHFMGNLIR